MRLSPVKLCWQHCAAANININCNLIQPQEFISSFANKKKTKTDFYLRMSGVLFPAGASTVAAAKLIPGPLDPLSLSWHLNLNFSHMGKTARRAVGRRDKSKSFGFFLSLCLSLVLLVSRPIH